MLWKMEKKIRHTTEEGKKGKTSSIESRKNSFLLAARRVSLLLIYKNISEMFLNVLFVFYLVSYSTCVLFPTEILWNSILYLFSFSTLTRLSSASGSRNNSKQWGEGKKARHLQMIRFLMLGTTHRDLIIGTGENEEKKRAPHDERLLDAAAVTMETVEI